MKLIIQIPCYNEAESLPKTSPVLSVEPRMMPKDTELFRRIDEVAFHLWDPIGVCEFQKDGMSTILLASFV